MKSPSFSLLLTSLLLPQLTPTYSKPILGVDLGSMYMKVALVQRNAPLEIIVNMHSKRKTEHMILFDSGTRFYGSDASSLIARKPTFTPYSMNMLLGRDESHPVVKVNSNLFLIILVVEIRFIQSKLIGEMLFSMLRCCPNHLVWRPYLSSTLTNSFHTILYT